MTADLSSQLAENNWHGIVSITWGSWAKDALREVPDPERFIECLSGYTTSITEMTTGRKIETASSITISAPIDGQVTAELTMFADKDGKPIFDGPPVFGDDGAPVTGQFWLLVNRLETTPRKEPGS